MKYSYRLNRPRWKKELQRAFSGEATIYAGVEESEIDAPVFAFAYVAVNEFHENIDHELFCFDEETRFLKIL